MKDINFQLLDEMKYLLSTGKSLKEISVILKLDLNYVKYLSKKIKTDVIQSSNCEEFYLVPLIDKLLNKKYRHYNKFPYEHQYKILDILHLSDEEIIKNLNINMPRFLSFLRAMYFMLYTYNIDGVDKAYLPIIKSRIDNIDCVVRNKKYSYTINEYNGLSDVSFPNGITRRISIPHGRIYNLSERDIKFIVISDTHFGAWYENFNYLNKVYEYAIRNGINYIVVTGDLIEGNCFDYDRCKSEYKSIKAQMDHVFLDYCYDDSIKNIILLGNHDFSAYVKEGIDIGNFLSIRDDFNIIGYKEGYLKIRDEFITLKHEVSKILNSIDNPCSVLNIVGHSHQYRTTYNDDSVVLKVPCLCDVYAGIGYVVNKGFVVCELNFDDLGLCNMETEFVRFDEKDNIKFQRVFRK